MENESMARTDILKKLRREINRGIGEILEEFTGIPVARKMLGYQVGLLKGDRSEAQGKRFRPILCLLSCMAISGGYKKALPAGIAIELVHNFSLIHDDIQDEDRYRRGRLTLWKKWGRNQAINAGDAMHTLSNLALQKLFEVDLPENVIKSVFLIINNACYQMCEGQMLDIDFEKRREVSIPEYLRMIQKKTAALIESASIAGALIATENQMIVRHFKGFGFNTGMAFQIFNDLSGFYNSEARFVHLKSDLERNKKSLPVLIALGALKPGHRKSMDTGEMLKFIEKSGAIERARIMGEDYLRKAIFELDKTGIRNSVQELLKEYITGIKRMI